ncbi:hypothetical protein IMY05_014G0061100 [Salix suchowensis]|nr:hypothetical protein IMY05_014G0061100 [Salix suchowensis]
MKKHKQSNKKKKLGPILPPKMTTIFNHKFTTVNKGPIGPHNSAIPKSKKTGCLLLSTSLLRIITIHQSLDSLCTSLFDSTMSPPDAIRIPNG